MWNFWKTERAKYQTLTITSLFLKHTFLFWRFYLNFHLLYQCHYYTNYLFNSTQATQILYNNAESFHCNNVHTGLLFTFLHCTLHCTKCTCMYYVLHINWFFAPRISKRGFFSKGEPWYLLRQIYNTYLFSIKVVRRL